MSNESEEQKHYERVKKRVQRLRGFYSNLIVFAVVMAVLLIYNVYTNPENLWSLWVGLFWGAILVIQAVSIFTIRDSFLGSEWERRTIEKMLQKEKKSKEK